MEEISRQINKKLSHRVTIYEEHGVKLDIKTTTRNLKSSYVVFDVENNVVHNGKDLEEAIKFFKEELEESIKQGLVK